MDIEIFNPTPFESLPRDFLYPILDEDWSRRLHSCSPSGIFFSLRFGKDCAKVHLLAFVIPDRSHGARQANVFLEQMAIVLRLSLTVKQRED